MTKRKKEKTTKTKRRISHAGARQKGLKFERHVAEEFRRIGYKGAGRQLEFQIDEAKGIDLKNTGRYRVQCKKYFGYVSVNKINEVQITKEDRKCGAVPVLITAGNNSTPMAILPFSDFLVLLQKEIQATSEIEKAVDFAKTATSQDGADW